MKRCYDCDQTKPVSAFGKKSDTADGLSGRCKSCKSTVDRAYRELNRVRLLDRAKKYRESHKTEIAAGLISWRMRNKERFNAYSKATRDRNPGKHKARTQVTKAVKAGRIQKDSVCGCCGIQGKLEGHHEDYTKPLEVVWLCFTCHRNIHKEKVAV
jgi:hypothetical protein